MALNIIEVQYPPEVQRRLDELDVLFNTDEVMKAIDALSEQIESIPLARRFSKEIRVTRETYRGGSTLNPGSVGLTEQEHKRRELQLKVDSLRLRFTLLQDRFQAVYLEVEASQREYG